MQYSSLSRALRRGLVPVTFTWLLTLVSSLNGAEASSKFYFKNLTRTQDYIEVNPRFVNDGNYVLFLVFVGNPASPGPADYVLTKCDRDGHLIYYMSTRGVLDYNVLENESGVLVLKAVEDPETATAESSTPYEQQQAWELWYINFENDEEVLLEASMGLPLSEGYRMLGLTDLPDSNLGQIRSLSPHKTNQLLVKRDRVDDYWVFRYYRVTDDSEPDEVFRSESWVPLTDQEWWPTIRWLNESTFVTVSFNSALDEKFPQSQGLFSIVSVDLEHGTGEVLYSDFDIHPFPKVVLSPSGQNLYFQKSRNGFSEIWRLNLVSRSAEILYRVEGELGEVRISPDETSLVFTQHTEDNFDIIRLDVDSGHLRR